MFTTLFYNISIKLYLFVIYIVSPFHIKAKKWIVGRKNWELKLSKQLKGKNNWIWFHCSSLGEFEDSAEIFLKIKKQFPSDHTILTVFSPSAFDVLKNSKTFDIISYLPLDSKNNSKKFIDIIHPKLAIFSRSELWLHYLLELKSKKIPTFLVSLSLNKGSNFIRFPFKFIYKKCFHSFLHVYCQNTITIDLLKTCFNYHHTTYIGNPRIERISQQTNLKMTFSEIEKFIANNKVIIVGSSLPKDEIIIIDALKKLKHLNLKWLIVPHEFNHSILEKKLHFKDYILHSKLNDKQCNVDILIIDKVGLLKHLYKYANFAHVGGGFDPIGIHNIIEPAIYGIPISIGPNHKNYKEALDLITMNAATIINNSQDLCTLIEKTLSIKDSQVYRVKITNYIKTKTMLSSEITCNSILEIVKDDFKSEIL